MLKKTKGHATDEDVQEGRSSAFEKCGNDNADHFAGRGVDVAIHQSPNQRLLGAYRVGIGLATPIPDPGRGREGRLLKRTPRDCKGGQSRGGKATRRVEKSQNPVTVGMKSPHML